MGYYQIGYMTPATTIPASTTQNYYYGIAGQDGLVMNVNTYYDKPS